LKKQAKPDKYVPKIAVLDDFISANRKACSSYAEGIEEKKDLPFEEMDALFRKVIFQETNKEVYFDEFLASKTKEV